MHGNRAQKIGASVIANEARWKAIQKAVGTSPADGWPGRGTVAALEAKLGITVETPTTKPKDVPKRGSASVATARNNWPSPDSSSMNSFYGRPAQESNLVRVPFPYKMRLYKRGAALNVKSHRAHKRCGDSLAAILGDLLGEYGLDGLEEYGLDVFGGIYNDRSVRGGRSKSKHAWGCAIDLNPLENQNRQKWLPPK